MACPRDPSPRLTFEETEAIVMSVRAAIMQIAPADEDASVAVAALLGGALDRFLLLHQQRLSSERYVIEEVLRGWCDEGEIDLIVTLGGTFPAPGPSGDEIVPEATAAVLERRMPSLPETMRAHAGVDDPLALLDRGVAGIRGRTLIMNLPAGATLSVLFLESVLDLLPPILQRLRRPADEGGGSQVDGEQFPPAENREQRAPRGLDPDEFADFLRLRNASETNEHDIDRM